MNLALSVIIGLVVLVFALMAFAPLLTEPAPEKEVQPPRLRLIEGGKPDVHKDAA